MLCLYAKIFRAPNSNNPDILISKKDLRLYVVLYVAFLLEK